MKTYCQFCILVMQFIISIFFLLCLPQEVIGENIVEKMINKMADKAVIGVNDLVGVKADDATLKMQKAAFKFVVDPRQEKTKGYYKEMQESASEITGNGSDEKIKPNTNFSTTIKVNPEDLSYVFVFGRSRKSRRELYLAFYNNKNLHIKRLTDNIHYSRSDWELGFMEDSPFFVFFRELKHNQADILAVNVITNEIKPIHISLKNKVMPKPKYDTYLLRKLGGNEERLNIDKDGWFYLNYYDEKKDEDNGAYVNFFTGEKRSWSVKNFHPDIIFFPGLPTYYGKRWLGAGVESAIYKLDSNGNKSKLYSLPAFECYVQDFEFHDISNDGSRVLFRSKHEQDPPELYIYNNLNRKVTRLTYNDKREGWARFLPDGRIITSALGIDGWALVDERGNLNDWIKFISYFEYPAVFPKNWIKLLSK